MIKGQALVNLITPEYQQTLQTMHAQQAGWAKSGPRFLERVCALIDEHQPAAVLDYGCGKGALAAELHKKYPALTVYLYDPGLEQFTQLPPACDFVICTDVLEHIEPDYIEAVLEHIACLTHKVAYFVVHTGDCGHKLPDGRPAHILQRDQVWWEAKLIEAYRYLGFELTFKDTGRPMRFEATAVRIADAAA
jgi:SAM-dependent methyltransferase